MSAIHFTISSPGGKPRKPYPEFPLFPHVSGQWTQTIRGRLHDFGVWADPDGTLQRHLEQKDDLYAGRTPRSDPANVTIDVCDAFSNA
jgi:hypothetical protein